jgi:hypothetical protein
MPSYTKEDILKAINLIQNGQLQARAAKEATVPRSSLQDRLQGILPQNKAHSAKQQLGPAIKDDIIRYLRL